jgi:hypothetical protein
MQMMFQESAEAETEPILNLRAACRGSGSIAVEVAGRPDESVAPPAPLLFPPTTEKLPGKKTVVAQDAKRSGRFWTAMLPDCATLPAGCGRKMASAATFTPISSKLVESNLLESKRDARLTEEGGGPIVSGPLSAWAAALPYEPVHFPGQAGQEGGRRAAIGTCQTAKFCYPWKLSLVDGCDKF